MKYVRMNITLPADVTKRLKKVPNKSAFIAEALVDRFKRLDYDEYHERVMADLREAKKHPEWEKDERDDW